MKSMLSVSVSVLSLTLSLGLTVACGTAKHSSSSEVKDASAPFLLGFTFSPVSTNVGTMLQVASITPGGRASNAGFQVSDLINSIDGTTTDSSAAWSSALSQARQTQSSMNVLIYRNGSPMTLNVPFTDGGNRGNNGNFNPSPTPTPTPINSCVKSCEMKRKQCVLHEMGGGISFGPTCDDVYQRCLVVNQCQ